MKIISVVNIFAIDFVRFTAIDAILSIDDLFCAI